MMRSDIEFVPSAAWRARLRQVRRAQGIPITAIDAMMASVGYPMSMHAVSRLEIGRVQRVALASVYWLSVALRSPQLYEMARQEIADDARPWAEVS